MVSTAAEMNRANLLLIFELLIDLEFDCISRHLLFTPKPYYNISLFPLLFPSHYWVYSRCTCRIRTAQCTVDCDTATASSKCVLIRRVVINNGRISAPLVVLLRFVDINAVRR